MICIISNNNSIIKRTQVIKFRRKKLTNNMDMRNFNPMTSANRKQNSVGNPLSLTTNIQCILVSSPASQRIFQDIHQQFCQLLNCIQSESNTSAFGHRKSSPEDIQLNKCTIVPSPSNRNDNNYAIQIFANRSSSINKHIVAKCLSEEKNKKFDKLKNNYAFATLALILSSVFALASAHNTIDKTPAIEFLNNDIVRIAPLTTITSNIQNLHKQGENNHHESHLQHRYGHTRDRRSKQEIETERVYTTSRNNSGQNERSIHYLPIKKPNTSVWRPVAATLINVPKNKTNQQQQQLASTNRSSEDNSRYGSTSVKVVMNDSVRSSTPSLPHGQTNSSQLKIAPSMKITRMTDYNRESSAKNTLISDSTVGTATNDQQHKDLLATSPSLESPLTAAVTSSSPSMYIDRNNDEVSSGRANHNDKKTLVSQTNNDESGGELLDRSDDDRRLEHRDKVERVQNRHVGSNNAVNARQKIDEATNERLVRMSTDNRHASISKGKDGDLEVFLENMNHMELRAAAFGRPMPNSFLEKPLSQHKPVLLSSAAEATSSNGELSRMQSHRHHSHHSHHHHALHHEQSRLKHSRESHSECALILQRTYVKHSNEKNEMPYGKTEQACISYKDIDRAIELAKDKLKFNKKLTISEGLTKSLEPTEAAIAAVGEINMAVTQILADKFDLSNDEILNGLPLIDMSKTKFWKICPLLVKPIKCEPKSRFRSFTGHCNNPHHPTWGAARTPFARYLPPVHPDGIWEPRKSIITEITYEITHGHHETHANHNELVSADHDDHEDGHPDGHDGHDNSDHDAKAAASIYLPAKSYPATSRPLELPSPRLVTSVVHRDVNLPSHEYSILFMSWGQLLDHDMSRAAQPPPDIKCCNQTSGQPRNKLCLPISVPQDDPFYSRFGVKCLEFRRSLAGLRPNCVLGPRVHQNGITAPIDANFVYGSSLGLANNLRLFKGGKLRSRDWFKKHGLKPILPAQEEDPDLECIARPRNLFCFLAGDLRANEQIHLTVLHTHYMRDHNRMAHRLGQLNPHWKDDRIYHEVRHITAATVQNVILNEYLPLLIGEKMTQLYNLTQPTGGGYWHGYDPTVTTSVSNSFAAAAFRQGHTFIQGTVEKYNKFHQFIASERLRNLFKQPFSLYEPGVIDQLTGGMINQPTQSYDPFMTEDISGHLFQLPQQEFGHDLPAINLQRGREQGLPGYNLFREWCGLPRAETFADLEPFLTNRTATLYSRLYKHVDDIDLWSGGVSERRLQGAAIGPTFACIIARQFSNTRRGDRYWFENPGFASSFTPDQLIELRKSSLAKLLCVNSDDLPTIQRWAMKMPHPVLNPRTPCEELPDIDLQYWQEDKKTGHYFTSRSAAAAAKA